MTDRKKKTQALITKQNVLESLKDLGTAASGQTADLLKTTSEDFFKELVGIKPQEVKKSGEIEAGGEIILSEVLSGKEEENKKLRAQISLERQLSMDEKRLSREKSDQLRVQLQALMSEVAKVSASTQVLAEETKIAMIEAPAQPGIYHIVFFQKVLEFLVSFRKKIEEAGVWLSASNKRAEKKNYWSMYKKKGSSFLLSPDHYLQRSAG
jgi:hypothetical protein